MTEREWLVSTDPAAMLQHLQFSTYEYMDGIVTESRHPGPSDRKLRLFACACCRQVWDETRCPACVKPGRMLRQLSPFDAFGRSSSFVEEDCNTCHGTGRVGGLTDPRSRRAVEVAERYADGEATVEDLRKVHREMLRWNRQEWGASGGTEGTTLTEGFGDTIWPLCVTESNRQLAELLPAHIGSVPVAPAQAALLRDIFGSPFRKPYMWVDKLPPDSALKERRSWLLREWLRWNDGTVPRIARSIYDERRWQDMGILADALLDAGCDDESIISHCREPLHTRGCWVLDLILGKE